MAIKTYTVGDKSGVRRLDELTGPWIDVPINIVNIGDPVGGFIDVILRDVMTDPQDSSKVFAVGGRNRTQGATGIYVSDNGGAVWYQPAGDINDFSANNFTTFWEVWVVDSNTIYASGNNGHVFKSTDGGASFNRTATLPTGTGSATDTHARALHFISPTTGIVGVALDFGGLPEVWKTTDGGSTWTRLNGDAVLSGPVNTDEIWGIHLSADEQIINVTGKERHIRSTDGGATFSSIINYSAQGRHLTWTDDNNLYIFGTGEYRLFSDDQGATWNELSPYNPFAQPHYAGHLYTLTDGFYGFGYDVLSTDNAFVNGTFSETSPYGVEAVWTTDDEPVPPNPDPDDPCGCPEGTTYNPTSDQCEGFETTQATVSSTIYTVGDGENAVSYGWGGTNFYNNIDSANYPISSLGGSMNDDSNNPIGIQQNVQSSLWGDAATANAETTILNNIGVWATLPVPNLEWIGFTACVEVPETKEYFIGLAADNLARFKVNGVLIVEFEDCQNTFNFNYWHVFPITLQAGTNVIELEGANCGSVAAFGAEIYDATLAQLTAMTSQPQLDAVTIFSTIDKVGSTFDTGEDSGYQCPEGWALSLCDGAYTCVRQISAPFEPCNCYLAMDCDDPTITMLVTTEDPLDTNSIYQFDGTDQCWTIIPSTECDPAASFNVPSVAYVDCRTCQGLCYILTDCEGNEPDKKVSNDFAAYVGQVIRLTVCPDVCWQVSEAPDCDEPTEQVTLSEVFVDCVSCLPPPPEPEPLTLRPRAIEPAHPAQACDMEYVHNVECSFVDAIYQKMVSRRYGIEFCCEFDLRKWTIKHKLLQLELLHDKNACPNPTCCPPSDVTATLN